MGMMLMQRQQTPPFSTLSRIDHICQIMQNTGASASSAMSLCKATVGASSARRGQSYTDTSDGTVLVRCCRAACSSECMACRTWKACRSATQA